MGVHYMKNLLKLGRKQSRTSAVMDALLPSKPSKMAKFKKALKHALRKRVQITVTLIK